MDDKYITFKLSDWNDFMDAPRSLQRNDVKRFGEDKALKDSVVIRLRDTFASAALHTYANSIAITAKLLGDHFPTTSKNLQRTADYFHEQAIAADDTDSKLPD